MLPPRVKRLFRLAARRGARVEEEMDDEIRFHLEARAEQLVRRGLAPDAARLEAERRFGALDDARRHLRHSALRREDRMRLHETLAGLTRDARYALRSLRRRPGFVAGVVLTLALGIGANVTMFGIVDRLLLRPPALLRDPGTVGRIYSFRVDDGKETANSSFGYRRFLDLREGTHSFDQMVIYADLQSLFGVGEEAKRERVEMASASLWPLFGIRPTLGRFFTESEDRLPQGEPVAVLSYAYWQSRYGGDPGVLGKRIRIGGTDYSVIGVAPRGFTGMASAKLAAFVPFVAGSADQFREFHLRSGRWYDTYNLTYALIAARRKAGVSVEQANADLAAAMVRSYEKAIALRPAGQTGRPLSQIKPRAAIYPVIDQRGPERGANTRVATWLAGVAMLVLLMACANVANLLLARATQQRRELAVRVALGVSRARLLAGQFMESGLLALAGAGVGLLVAWWGGGLLRRTLLPDVDWSTSPVDGRLLAFTIGATLFTALLTGLAPALHGRREELTASLKAGGREGSAHRSRMRSTLLVVQAAVSVVLLVGAGLFVRSLGNVRALDMGFDVERVLLLSPEMRGVATDSLRQQQLLDRLVSRAAELPSVERAAETLTIPFYSTWTDGIAVPGRDSSQLAGEWQMNTVSPGFFETVGTRLVRGRGITASDVLGAPLVIVVSQSAARAIWPGEDALGKCVKQGDTLPCMTVVGIAQDIRSEYQAAPSRNLYMSLAQNPTTQASLYVRTRGDATKSAESVRRELQKLMPGDSYIDAQPLEDLAAPSLRPWKLGATMFSLFGALALIVAAVGLYSVISYGVTQRAHELGVRIALGARAADVMRLVLGEGMRVTLVGIALGSAAALLAGKWVKGLLFEVSPRDPLTFGLVLGTLLAIAVVASLVPAVRASRVDPNRALRAD